MRQPRQVPDGGQGDPRGDDLPEEGVHGAGGGGRPLLVLLALNPPTDNDLFAKSLQCEARAGESSPSPNVAKKWDNVRRGSDHMPMARASSSPGNLKDKARKVSSPQVMKKAASVAKVASVFTRSRANTASNDQ